MVEADLRRGARRSPRLAVLRSVRAWLLIAALVLLFALGAAIGSARASGAPTRPQVVVAGIAAVAPVVVSVAVDGWRRSLDFPRTRHDTQPAGVALGAA
jgi:membrane protein YdbS with pleckstrin-like domain